MSVWSATKYRPRVPTDSVLFRVLDENLASVLIELEETGHDLPWFVRRELEGFLRCGIAECGAALARCRACSHERLVPWSCKGRGFCPACTTRRMHDTAAFLVARVLPGVPVRMWVLSFPPPLRYLLAYDSKLCAQVLGIFLGEVFSWLRHAAKRELSLRSVRHAFPGSVTMVQRFGDGLRCNLHLHVLALDGVYVQTSDHELPVFRALPAPSKLDAQIIGTNVWMKTTRLLQKLGRYFDADPGDADALAREHPLLAACCAAAVQNTVALGPRAGQRILRVGAPHGLGVQTDATETEVEQGENQVCTPTHGYNVHAGVRISAQDRGRLERLCRYAARGPIAADRLSLTPDGHVVYRLRKKWRDGTTLLVFTPRQLIQRLVALVPPPRFNLTRFHGVLASRARLRAAVVPKSPDKLSRMSQQRLFGRDGRARNPPVRKDGRPRVDPRQRATWSQLLEKTFPETRNVCPRCGGKLEIVSSALPPAAIRRFLELHHPVGNDIPDTRLARGPPPGQLPLFAGLPQHRQSAA